MAVCSVYIQTTIHINPTVAIKRRAQWRSGRASDSEARGSGSDSRHD